MAKAPTKTRGFGAAMQEAPPADTGADMAADTDTGADEADPREPASPEEQAAYEAAIDQLKQLLYAEDKLPSVLERLAATKGDQSGAGGTIDDIANVAVMLVVGLKKQWQEQGQALEGPVLYQVGVDTIELLGELVEAAGIAEVDEKMLEGALYRALDYYVQSGEADKEALAAEFGQLAEADQQGRLGEMLPGIKAPAAEAGE